MRRRGWNAQTVSHRLARSPRPAAQRRDLPSKSYFGPREPEQNLLEGIPSEIPRIQLEHAGPPHGAPGHESFFRSTIRPRRLIAPCTPIVLLDIALGGGQGWEIIRA